MSLVTLTARQFTAANSEYFVAASNTPFDCGNTDTYMCAWCYHNSLPGSNTTQVIMAKWDDAFGTTRDYIFGLRNTAGTIRYRWLVKDGAGVVFANNFGLPVINTWYFLECYHDATNDLMWISVNGTSDSTSYSGGSTAGNTSFKVGALNGTPTAFMNGRMAGLGFWQGTIPDSTKRASFYNGGLGKRYVDLTADEKTGLISYWNGDEASGNLIDGTGTNNLTDTNTVTSNPGVITYDDGVSTRRKTALVI